MTDMENSFLQKKLDLKLYYNMAQEAYQENDLEQALKITKNGLKQAKLQNSGDWIDKFDSLNFNISQDHSESVISAQEASLISSLKKEVITIVKGIGPKIAEKLNEIGVYNVAELAQSPPDKIAKIHGIGLATALKYISNAKEHMRMKKLNDFSGPKNPHKSVKIPRNSDNSLEIESVKETIIPEIIHGNIEENDDSESVSKHNLYEDNNQQGEIETRFEEDLDFEEDMKLGNTMEVNYEKESNPRELIKTIEPTITPNSPPTIEIAPEAFRQSTLAVKESRSRSQEALTFTEIKELLQKIAKSLKLSDFNIIERLPELRSIYTGIDLLGIKHVRVKEFVDLIYIIPIKIFSLNGSLIVSSEQIQYNSVDQSEEADFRTGNIAQLYLKALSQVTTTLYSNLNSEGPILQYISRYLSSNISLEKSITRKNLFFRSGPLQYKIFVEPVLISQNRVGFTEKVIPFAYQKNSNIHIVEYSKLGELIQFLDQKYFLIETFNEEKNAVILDCDATNKFMSDLRKYSMPYMVYGIILLFILLSQTYSALPILINLGYGIVSIYIVMVSYLYLKLNREKSALSQKFSTPYYQKNFNFEDGTLYLINEELSEQYMEQFVFECVGNAPELQFLNKLETVNAERFLSERLQHKRIEESNFFEQETPMNPINPDSIEPTPRKEEQNSKTKDKYIDKYSSFLED
ncbi:MAG: helix-hairpin-helix domain-containing protein [Promethearchaeota archaeon]